MLFIPLGLLSYAVGKRTSSRMGWSFAALLIGLPAALLVVEFGPFGGPDAPEPTTRIVHGNPYQHGSAEHAQFNRGKDLAAALVDQGKGPGPGMADDFYLRWCRDRLTPAVGSRDRIPHAMTEGCINGAR
ncbi:hypothetical protein [Streptomyces sp. MST-110588]|uniref:hypothetical protein n=1 Tax=Streptomyces sp. MST-110588 TaxID=2833628 RepID=UPI001F5DC1DB|nr:hypothetical protein [Streptomyces sp. MST-110588]UNO40763.1 hypothetical protein KGS77_15760 [Streptomyces sp. MST-110588]